MPKSGRESHDCSQPGSLMEHTVYDDLDGSIVTSNLADYAVPVNADIPDRGPLRR